MESFLNRIRSTLIHNKLKLRAISSPRTFLLLFIGCSSSFILNNDHNPPPSHTQAHRAEDMNTADTTRHISQTLYLPSLDSTSIPTRTKSSSSEDSSLLKRDSKWDHARSYSTSADVYYKTHGTIPPPTQLHTSLLDLLQSDTRTSGFGTTTTTPTTLTNPTPHSQGILIIGDVHGCYHELVSLVQKALEYNQNMPFQAILLVGDICNKGPYSSQVITYIRKQRHWFSVRGNHEDGALAATLGDKSRRKKKKYQWMVEDSKSLTDEDVEWLANLPYTITIPFSFLEENCNKNKTRKNETSTTILEDVVVVHAGFLPFVEIEQQDIETMVTVREVEMIGSHTATAEYRDPKRLDEVMGRVTSHHHAKPWASIWSGKQVVFGHDARRGLQIHSHAIGIDTGACYGKYLTGIILPSKTIVSVPSKKNYAHAHRNL